MKSLIVLGGGLTGLTAAYLASRAGYKVKVIESAEKFGGLLDTLDIGGTKLEKYYHHFFTHDKELLWLLNELGLSYKVRYHNSTMGIFSNGSIYNFNGPSDLLKMGNLSVEDKLRFAFTSLYLSKFADWKSHENTPIYDWFLRYAGKNVTEVVWGPLLKAKFGPYYAVVPVSWMIGRLSQRAGSRSGVKEQLGYLDGSMDILVQALTGDLAKRGVELHPKTTVHRLVCDKGKITGVETSEKLILADTTLSTIPTGNFSRLVKEINPTYATDLDKIEYFGAICLLLELVQPLSSIYWLNIADDKTSFGGVIEHTNLIPVQNYGGSHVVYLSRYFSQKEGIANMSRSEVEGLMTTDLQRIFPSFNKSVIKTIHFFKTSTAATLCDLNFSHKVPACKTPLENLYAVNMAHIYPDERSCNNSIRTAANACKAMGIDTSYVPKGRSLSGLIGMD